MLDRGLRKKVSCLDFAVQMMMLEFQSLEFSIFELMCGI